MESQLDLSANFFCNEFRLLGLKLWSRNRIVRRRIAFDYEKELAGISMPVEYLLLSEIIQDLDNEDYIELEEKALSNYGISSIYYSLLMMLLKGHLTFITYDVEINTLGIRYKDKPNVHVAPQTDFQPKGDFEEAASELLTRNSKYSVYKADLFIKDIINFSIGDRKEDYNPLSKVALYKMKNLSEKYDWISFKHEKTRKWFQTVSKFYLKIDRAQTQILDSELKTLDKIVSESLGANKEFKQLARQLKAMIKTELVRRIPVPED